MNILITGGSRGIGKETALSLAADRNNQILITGRNENALKETVMSAVNNNISYYILDLNELDNKMRVFYEHVSSCFSILDVLINNSGSLVNKKFNDLKDNEVDMMMRVNYFAPVTLIRSLFPLLRKGSHIVNISSMGGFQGSAKFPGLSCYSASKAAIACLTECLAAEYLEYGISVNCLALGSVQTEMLNEAFPNYRAPVTAEEMGEYVARFAHEGNKYHNGKIIPVALTTP